MLFVSRSGLLYSFTLLLCSFAMFCLEGMDDPSISPSILQYDSDDVSRGDLWTRESLLSERQKLAKELFYDASDMVLLCFGVARACP